MATQNPQFAVIFDKDGVLVDTEGIIASAVEAVVTKHSDIPYDPNDNARLRGNSAMETFTLLVEEYKLPFAVDEALVHYQEEYVRLLTAEQKLVIPGVRELLEDLRSHHIPYGIGTNSNRVRTEMSIREIADEFSVIVTSDDVSAPKPSPEVFLAVSSALRVLPEQCVVVGDTNKDAVASKAAGMKFVYFNHGLDLMITEKPDLTITSMRELDAKKLGALFS